MTRFRSALSRTLVLLTIVFWVLGARAEHYTVPLLVSPGTSQGPQGVLRILNGNAESGAVEIYAIDDSGTHSGPAAFTLSASAAIEFTATDLQSGNATLGLTGGIGTDVGDVRLEIETDLDIVPLAFVRAPDGTLSAMHDTIRGVSSAGESGVYTYQAPIFNLSTEMVQVSRLRLINPGDAAAAVTITGRDDSGEQATGGDVTLMLPAGGSRTLTAQQLEAGDADVTGQLGAGTGKWRLTVSSDQPLQVVNIVASTAGYWNNLSTTAVPGEAPLDQAGLNERFIGNSVIYDTSSGRFTFNAMDGDRFTETGESGGVTTINMGSYGYTGIGPDAGQLTLDYDAGDTCRASLYFSSRTSGMLVSRCTGEDHPDGYWIGGIWTVEHDGEDGSGEAVPTTYAVNDALPGVPTSGVFVPTRTSVGSSITTTPDGTTIALNDGAYFELTDGTRYTCTSADGCGVVNGTVTRGTFAGRAPGAGGDEVDQFPTFRTAVSPGDQTYTTGTAIDTLTLPEASSGNAPLTYSLAPNVPGLSFNATVRQLTGTPSTLGAYAMRYTVTDDDGDTATLRFTITVTDKAGSLGECYVGLLVGIGQSCTYSGTTDEFSVNVRGRGRILDRLFGIRIRINDETINGRAYDFEASHQGDGVWRIDRIAGSPDLSVGSQSVSISGPETGEPFTLSATVTNQGDGESAATTLRYYLSTDTTITTSDTPLGADAIAALAAGGTSSQSISATAPSSTGTYYYGACVDAVRGEADTTNNCSASVQVDVSEQATSPDLAVGAPSVSDSSPETGGSFTLSALVSNQGDEESPATTLRYYRSADATITTSDIEVGTVAIGVLAASGTSSGSISLMAPSTAGTYYYGACVDAVNGESDITNNCSASVQMDVSEPPTTTTPTTTQPVRGQPDLVVGALTVSNPNLEPAGTLMLSATVSNTGDGGSTATTLRYYWSTDQMVTTTHTEVGTDDVGALAVNGTSEESISLTARRSMGRYFYGACVDAVANESDTTNNCSAPVTVEVNEPQQPEGLPSVGLSRVSSSVTEGMPARYTVTATPPPTANLVVHLDYIEFATVGDRLIYYNWPPTETTVTITGGTSSTTLTVPTIDDSDPDGDSVIHAEVTSGSGYTIDSDPFKRVVYVGVVDDD